MGFTVTVPTALPVNADGTLDQATWGEAGGPFSVPAEEGAGLGAVTLASNTVNYEWQHPARWLRSMVDRMALSDEGLLVSCVLKQGAWNTGGGTLDVTLGPTRVVVDANDDGGIVIEIKAPVGSPETLLASRDTYLNINEAGAFELLDVANGSDPLAPTAGFVSIWKLVTDATELTLAIVADGVAPVPCFGPNIGIRAAVINAPTLGTEAADPVSVIGTMTVAEVATFDKGAQGPAAAPLDLPQGGTIAPSKSIVGNASTQVTAGNVFSLAAVESGTGFQGTAGSIALLPQGATISVNKSLTLGTDTPSLVGETAKSTAGDVLYHNGDNVQAPGIAISTQQVANTGAAVTVTTMTTTTRQDAPVNLYVTVGGYFSRSAVGTLVLKIEESDGAFIYSTLISAFTTPLVGAAFEYHEFTRLRTIDSTNRLFRLVATTGDAELVDIKEALLTVYPAGG